MAHGTVEIPLKPERVSGVEVARGQVDLPARVLRGALRERGNQFERFRESGRSGLEVPLLTAHLADLVDRLRPPADFLVTQSRCRHRREVHHGLFTDGVEQIETANALQLAAQVAEHESDEDFRLVATPVGVLARQHGGVALASEVDRVLHAADDRDDHQGRRKRESQPTGWLLTNAPEAFDNVHGGGPLRGGDRLQLPEQITQVAGDTGRWPRVAASHFIEQCREIGFQIVGRRPGMEFLQQQSERIHVARRRRDLTGCLLRAHVSRCAHEDAVRSGDRGFGSQRHRS